MTTKPSVRSCRWAMSTLFLASPLWCEGAEHEWSCVRLAVPSVLPDPEICRTCAFWKPLEEATRGFSRRELRDGSVV